VTSLTNDESLYRVRLSAEAAMKFAAQFSIPRIDVAAYQSALTRT